ncbi:MAG: hypothetical protein PVJ34_20225 [Anaerolineae bacterium]|jgi:hypothetical protein
MAAKATTASQPVLRRSLWRLGLLSALVYLLAFTLPYWLPSYYLDVKDEIYQFAAREPWRGILFCLALAALFALYLKAYRLALALDRGQGGARLIGGWTIVFCLLLIPVYALTSSDIYGYVFQGRIVAVLGENPFAHLYKEFAADPFFPIVTFRGLPASTGYGPLWIALDAALGWLARDRLLLNLFLFKTVAAALHLAGAALVYGLLGRLDPERRVAGTLFYAWNPLLLYELVGNGHNDATVAALALLGFYLLARGRGLAAIVALSAAALVKPVAVLWLPPVALWCLARTPGWPARFCRGATMVGLALLLAAAAYAPFWQGVDTFRGLLVQSDIHGNSLPNLLIMVGHWLWPGAGPRVVEGVKLLTVLVFAPFYLSQLVAAWRAGTLAGLAHVAFDVMLFYLLFVGFQFWPWYLAWLLVPAALLPGDLSGVRRRLALILCGLALLLYFPFGWLWVRHTSMLLLMALLAAVPLLGVCAWLLVRAWRARS